MRRRGCAPVVLRRAKSRALAAKTAARTRTLAEPRPDRSRPSRGEAGVHITSVARARNPLTH